MNILPLPKMQAYCRLDGIIYDVNEVHLNETPQLVVLNRIEVSEPTYFPISGKDCEVFIMEQCWESEQEIYGKKLFDLDFVAHLSHKEEVVIWLMRINDFYDSLPDRHTYKYFAKKIGEIKLKLREKSGEYFELLKNRKNRMTDNIKIGNLFEYLDKEDIDKLFEIIKK